MSDRETAFLDAAVLSRLRGMRISLRTVADGAGHGLHHSGKSGFNNEFAGHRQYCPGDDTRHIDWRIYGKRERLVVREYGSDTNFPVVLALDTSASMAFSSTGDSSKLDYAKRLVSHLAFLLLGQHDHVGLAMLSDGHLDLQPPAAGHGRIEFLIEQLRRATPQGGTALGPALGRLVATLKRKTLCILFSDFLDGEPHEAVLRRFPSARLPGHLVRLFDQAELDFRYQRPRRFQDPEGGEGRLVDPQAVRPHYLAALAADRAELRRVCRGRGIGLSEFSTALPLAEALTRLIRQLDGGC